MTQTPPSPTESPKNSVCTCGFFEGKQGECTCGNRWKKTTPSPLPKLEYVYVNSIFFKKEDVVDEFGIPDTSFELPTPKSVREREHALAQELTYLWYYKPKDDADKRRIQKDFDKLIAELEKKENGK